MVCWPNAVLLGWPPERIVGMYGSALASRSCFWCRRHGAWKLDDYLIASCGATVHVFFLWKLSQ